MKIDARFISFVIVLAFCATPVMAAGKSNANSITVIQEDGTAVTVNLDDPDVILPGSDAPKAEAVPVPEVQPEVLKEEPRAAAPPKEKKKEAAKSPEKKSVKKKSKKKKTPPVPPRPPVQKDSSSAAAPGVEITGRAATLIALDAAPPSSGFTSMRQSYKGRDVYVVTFKTSDGPYDVLIDVVTGDVVVSGYVENEPEYGPTAPGHLPRDWQPYKPVPKAP
jgi:hypothetical protein